MPFVAIDLGCHTARACTRDGSTSVTIRSDVATGDDGAPALAHGVVVSEAATTHLVRTLLRRVRRFPLGPWRAVVCAPGCATPPERAALLRAVTAAGVQVVALVPDTLAAAIGGGADVSEDWSQMVVDVGHGVSDAGVIRAGRLVAVAAPGPGCGEVQRAVASGLASAAGTPIAPELAEALCQELPALRRAPLATLAARASGLTACASGLAPLGSDTPRARAALARAAIDAADAATGRIAAHVARFVRALPPQVGCEVIESDILLTGGGALLDGLAASVEQATGIRVQLAPRPLPAVLDGAREVLVVARRLSLDDLAPRAPEIRTRP